MNLSILCITEGRDYGKPFIAEMAKVAENIGCEFVLIEDGSDVHSAGHIESVLDEAISRCSGEYILRLDDDESLHPDAVGWLRAKGYRVADHWALQRQNLWPDAEHFIANKPLWPDLQTRLSVKAKSGHRSEVHAGSPYGTGRVAPYPILHHKFLVRSREEREALVQRYENIAAGAGSQYVMFSLPERYEEVLQCRPV